MIDSAPSCPECQGETVRMRGAEWDIEVWVCPRKDEPGHLTREEATTRFREYKKNFGPTARRWA